MASLEYLERIVALCRKHEIILAYDNAYCDIVFDGYRAPSIFEVPGADEVAVEFYSLSKSFSMTGWRIGFAVGRAPLIGPLTQVKTYTDTGPFLAVQEAGAVGARPGGGADRADLRGDRPSAQRDGPGAARRRLPGRAAEGGDVPLGGAPNGVTSKTFARHALEVEGVLVLPGSAFGPAGEGISGSP